MSDLRKPFTEAGTGTITGGGAATEVAFFSGPTAIDSDPELFWDDTSKLLQLGLAPTTIPAKLMISTPSTLLVMQKSTAPADFFAIVSSTGNPAALAPIFFGHLNDPSASGDVALYFLGTVAPATDNPGDEAAIWFAARRGDSSGGSSAALVNRPLFKWLNLSTEMMRMEANGYVAVGGFAPTATVDIFNGGFIDPALRARGGEIGATDGPTAIFEDVGGAPIMGVSVTGLVGRVGIGSVALAPTKTLDVGGDARITGKLTVGGAIDPTGLFLTGASKQVGATDAGPVFLAPFADAVTALQFRRADAVTVLLNADTTNERIQVGASAASGTEKVRVVAAATANGLRVEATGSGVGSPLVVNSTGTYTSTGQFLGYFANPTLTQTGGAFHGSTVRSLATFTLSATATTGQYYTFHDNNTLSFVAPAAIAAYTSFRANPTKSGSGTMAAMVGFLGQPGGGGVGPALYYGVFIDAYATPTVGVGGHFQGKDAALEVGAGAIGAAAITGRWFDSGKMVLGAAALDATETLKVAGEILTTADRGYKATAQTSSAGAALGTLANSPAAGDPTFWLKVNINGVALAIPCWPG